MRNNKIFIAIRRTMDSIIAIRRTMDSITKGSMWTGSTEEESAPHERVLSHYVFSFSKSAFRRGVGKECWTEVFRNHQFG
jgi:hypothetical protein